jgi:hypothetical protein
MKKALGMAGVVGVMAGSLALTSPASAEITIGDGNAVVVLTPCGKDKSLGSELVADCSYSAFKLKADGAPSYIYVTQDGYIVWKGGTITAGALDFPASGQTWPDLALKFSGIPITSSATPAKITGTVDSQGKVDLAMSFATTLKTPLGKCTLSGNVALSSAATDSLGKGVGKAYDPTTARFAAASTTPATVTTSGAAAVCGLLQTNYDLATGMGWLIDGYIGLPGGTAPPVVPPAPEPVDQTAKVSVPKKIKAKGETVILKKAVMTNADQSAKSKVTWSTKKNAKGTKKKLASVKTTKAGKVTITTKGKAKVLYVKLSLSAPATSGYKAYEYTKTWKIKK